MNLVERTRTGAKNLAIMYHDREQSLKDDLCDHLTLLRREGLISIIEQSREMPRLDIILLLISPSFVGSDQLLNATKQAIAYATASGRDVRIIPIRMREATLPDVLKNITGLPRTGPAIDMRRSAAANEALAQIAKEIRQVVENLA